MTKNFFKLFLLDIALILLNRPKPTYNLVA
jgi:hypothetical protein